MRSFVAFLVCVAVVSARLDHSLLNEELQELISNIHTTCIAQSPIAEDVIEKTHDGTFPDDKNLKCYMKCTLMQGGAMDKEGKIDYDAVENLLPEKLKKPMKESFEACKSKATSDDLCQRAFDFFQCCYQKDSVNYFLV